MFGSMAWSAWGLQANVRRTRQIAIGKWEVCSLFPKSARGVNSGRGSCTGVSQNMGPLEWLVPL